MEKQKEWVQKNRKLLYISATVIGLILTISVGYGLGKSNAKIIMNGEKLTIEELADKIQKLEKEVNDLTKERENLSAEVKNIEKEKSQLEEEVTTVKKEHNDIFELVENKENIKKEIEDAENELVSIQSELDSTKSELNKAKEELESVNGEIVKRAGEPISLMAGQYIVGLDIPAGRYQATNVGDGSNFFVYDNNEWLVVNTILGNDPYGLGAGDYVFFAEDGYLIETYGPIKLIPVE